MYKKQDLILQETRANSLDFMIRNGMNSLFTK